jgi:hypothetical protein
MSAYPPGFEPQEASFDIHPTMAGTLKVHIEGGLILDRDPDLENYCVSAWNKDPVFGVIGIQSGV